MRRLLAAAVLVLLTISGQALAKMYEEPRSFALRGDSLDRVDRKVLKSIDAKSLRSRSLEAPNKSQRPGPFQFAIAEDVLLGLDNSGTWRDVPNGRLWRLRIHSPGAVSHNLGITRFEIPEGAKLWVYDPERKQVEGPYTASHRSQRGSLWTPIIDGDEIVVELFVPAGATPKALVIGKVNKGFFDFRKEGADKNHGTCNNDVVCPEGDPWRDQLRSVARYTINGTSLCTGQMLNNTSFNFTPYFLSANHCGVTAANDDTLVFFWNFQAPTCGAQNGGSLADTQTGSIFRASSAASDFVLVELSQAPDPSFNVFFTGWDANGTAAASTVGIHHPRGDVKSISFNTNAVTSTAYYSNTISATATHWRVDDWEDGTTEGGSSGSCLWNATTKRCIGQLHGGDASCAASTSPDWYGKFSTSWTGGGTAATRLRDWLDPGNTGTLAIDGDPHITTLDGTHYDFQGAGEFVALRDPGGAEIQVRQSPIATTFAPGADAHHGLSTCVSLNTAVAARVGAHRVSYVPNLSGVPDPSGLQLRVDGVLTTLGASAINLGSGGRLAKTAAPGGIEINFPNKYTMYVTPGWWSSQGKWYLNIGVVPTAPATSMSGASPADGFAMTGGLGGAILRGSWLPALPDGSSLGPMPASLNDRYVALYQKFGEAWRVTGESSLFDYAAGTSTESFTLKSWPPKNPPCELPNQTAVTPLDLAVAKRLCRAVVGEKDRANCVFDVQVTGERGFARTYRENQRVAAGATNITVRDALDPSYIGQEVAFVAEVTRRANEKDPVRGGRVQFMLDGKAVGDPVDLDRRGQAYWKTRSLKPGLHKISASYLASQDSGLLSGTGDDQMHEVLEKRRQAAD